MKEVSIFGSGLIGSLLGIYLARQKDCQVNIYERRPDLRRIYADGGRSINLALSQRGWRSLEEVGLAQNVKRLGIPMYGRMMHSQQGTLTYQPYSKDNLAIYSVMRAMLNEELINCADAYDNLTFYFEHKCVEIDFRNTTAKIEDMNTGEQFSLRSDYLIGSDGAFSRVRASLQRTDRFNYAQEYLEHGYKELTIPPDPSGCWKLDKNALHIWPRKSFMLIALPNLDGSFTCTLFLAFEGENSFEALQTEKEVEHFFETYFPDALALMPDLVEEFFANPVSSLVTIRCAPWVKNNTLVIGDAAHAIVPFYGQGMNSGFEDCRLLNNILNEQSDWKKAFQIFYQNRFQDAEAIADLALQNFVEMRDLVADPQFLLRKKIENRLAELMPDKWIPLYTMVTFTDIPYSEAARIGKKQDSIMKKLMRMPDTAQLWQHDEWLLTTINKIIHFKETDDMMVDLHI
jgi:kynurenine 3-monooxygenase